jgi:Putative beta-barrel porin 2
VGVPQPRSVLFVPVTLAVLVYASSSRATEPGYQISAGVIETDNVQLAPGGTRDTIIEQEGSLIWHEQRPVFSADVDADLSHLTYVPRTFSDQVIGNFIGSARVAAIPQYLFWNISDNFGQGLTDPTAAASPSNRENINLFSTGPQALLPLSSVDIVDLNGTYGRGNYQHSPLNYQSFGGGAGLIHLLSASAELSVNLHDQRTDYANTTANSDFNLQEAFVHFDVKGRRTSLGIDGGYDRISGFGAASGSGAFSGSGASAGSALGRIQLSRKISASSSISFSAGRQYSEAGGAFQMSQVLGGANLNTQQSVQVGGPFTMTFVTAGWNFQRNRTEFGVEVAHFKDSYVENATFDDNRTSVDAHVSRRLTPTVRVGLTETLYRQTFENQTGNSTYSTSDARVTWQMSRRLSMAFAYSLARRTSDVPGGGFTENRVWVSIGYGRAPEAPTGPPAPPLPLPSAITPTR